MPVRLWSGAGVFFASIEEIRSEEKFEQKHAKIAKAEVAISLQPRQKILERAERLLTGEFDFFSSIPKTIGDPPDWFLDPFNGCRLAEGGHWSTLNEFSAGDIKNVWEASRFEWAPLLARAWCLSGDARYLETLRRWTLDWVSRNPAHAGPNWKCGQETSIRLINLLLAARILGAHSNPSPSLVNLVAIHCARILPTIRYAVAQNNNHGTSEAAALFIGGTWLISQTGSGLLHKKALSWRNAGRRWLEDRVTKLVSSDGSFSQYSTNYHRVLVDTLSQVEIWRQELREAPFSALYSARCCAAVEWLATMTDPDSGNVPNLGANDGAHLYNLSTASYWDFRPSVQLASVIFRGKRVFPEGMWDESLLWLGIESSTYEAQPSFTSIIHSDGGDLILRGKKSRGLVRFARFRFRPSHADCLHFDLWHRGENILRDGGTFSYNTESRWLDYFSGTESHNTVQFDGRNQMPRIGRFLFGEWLKMNEGSAIRQDGESLSWAGTYTDGKQVWHRRTVSVSGDVWRVTDEIGGFREKAVLRWRLIPGEWSLSGQVCESARAQLRVATTAPLRRLELTTGWESLYYQQKTVLPVFEIEVGPGQWTIETEITLKD
jgi:hypothetical protein